MPEEELAATLERDFPRISQSLTALANTADGWYDVPGIDGLTRLSRGKPVRTVPGAAQVPARRPRPADGRPQGRLPEPRRLGRHRLHPVSAARRGRRPAGVRRARRPAQPPQRRRRASCRGASSSRSASCCSRSWSAGQYFPRLGGAQETITDFEPVFTEERVRGAANGLDTIHEAIAFGDPLMTPIGGAAREAPRLYRFVAQRTGRRTADVRRALRRRAPQTTALLSAIPLTEVAKEIPRLLAYLRKALRMSRKEVDAALRKRTPGLTQALLTTPDVARAWNAIPRHRADDALRRRDAGADHDRARRLPARGPRPGARLRARGLRPARRRAAAGRPAPAGGCSSSAPS